MKLGTRILLVTLSVTIGLTLIVGGFVTFAVTAREDARARAQIEQAIQRGYIEQIDTDQRQIFGIVRLLLEDPQSRALLQSLIEEQGPAADLAITQLRDEVIARMVAREVGSLGLTPAFDVLLDAAATREPLLVGTRGDAGLERSLRQWKGWRARQIMGQPVPAEERLHGAMRVDPLEQGGAEGELIRQFVSTPEGLFIAFGMPLRVSMAEPPSHAYVIGFRVNDAWLTRMLAGRSERAGAKERAAQRGFGSAIHAWVRSKEKFVAYGSSGGALVDSAAPGPLRDFVVQAAGKPMFRGDARVNDLSFEVGGEQMVGEALSAGDTTLFFVSSLDEALAQLRSLQCAIAALGVAALVIGAVLCRWIARSISQPVNLLVAGTQRVSAGRFDEPVHLPRNDELGELAQSFNAMTKGLAQRDFIKDTFGKFVDPSVVEGLLSDPAKLKPGGEVREQTILFCDLAGFTSISEKMSPQDLVRVLNVYLGGAADAVAAERGIVDKFIGDAVMAFWGPPLTATHADRACRAALTIAQHARSLDRLCAGLGVSGLKVRVGIATGPVLVGNIGSPNKFNYTVIGDTCNLASRIEGINKQYGTSVLTTWETIALATGRDASAPLPEARSGMENGLAWRVVDRVRVVGKAQPIVLCEVMETATELAREYSAALRLYEARRWRDAAGAFAELAARTGDAPSAELASRCARFAQEGEPGGADGWDGVWQLTSK